MNCALWKLSEFDGYLCSLRHLIVLLLFSVILYLKDIKYDQVCVNTIFYDSRPFLFYNMICIYDSYTKSIPMIFKYMQILYFQYQKLVHLYIQNSVRNFDISHYITIYLDKNHCTLKKDICFNFFKPHEFDLFLPILSIF